MKTVSYLAIGDSYTIGEQVRLAENFPYQTVQLLRKQDRSAGRRFDFLAPEIVATTGWTTDELTYALDHTLLLQQYDLVSLLIGVNNQYRGRDTGNFETEFRALLQRAIGYAAKGKDHVFVISIPDWGVTPFAEGRDRNKIAKEIDSYNKVCERVSKELGVSYIDITAAQRKDAADKTMVAPDGLHPSGKEYAKWSAKLAQAISALY